MSHVEGRIAAHVETADIVVLSPADTARRIYLTFDSVGNRQCSYRTYVKGSDLFAKAGEALARTLALLIIENIISEITRIEPGELAQNPLAERGLQAGIALLASDDISGFTMAMLMNEVEIRVTRAIPRSHALAVWMTNTFQGIASDLYGRIFRHG